MLSHNAGSVAKRPSSATGTGGGGGGEKPTTPGACLFDSADVLSVRDLVVADQEWKLSTLQAGWGSTDVARLGELVDAGGLPGFVAERNGAPAGLVTFAQRADGVEVVTIQSLVEGIGVGRALMDRVCDHAVQSGAPRLWLMTTNDNLRAFAFYQRWGMDLIRVVHRGVDISREVKPSIPSVGRNGVPLRHELEFELPL